MVYYTLIVPIFARIVVPECLKEAHGGCFAGHLRRRGPLSYSSGASGADSPTAWCARAASLRWRTKLPVLAYIRGVQVTGDKENQHYGVSSSDRWTCRKTEPYPDHNAV